MALVPSGHRRTMVAQTYHYAADDVNVSNPNLNGTTPPARDEVQQQQITDVGAGGDAAPQGAAPQNPNPELGGDTEQTGGMEPTGDAQPGSTSEQDQRDEEKDIAQFVIQHLARWGWPLRAVQKYRENMVKENLSPGATGGIKKDITITAPNTYYGGASKRIQDKDFVSMVQQIAKTFGLRWVKADRAGIMMTVHFTSDMLNQGQDPAEMQLERVYGKKPANQQGGGGSAAPAKAASTLGEMLTLRRDELYETMRKIAKGS